MTCGIDSCLTCRCFAIGIVSTLPDIGPEIAYAICNLQKHHQFHKSCAGKAHRLSLANSYEFGVAEFQHPIDFPPVKDREGTISTPICP